MRGCALVQTKLSLNVVLTVVYGWRQKKSIEIIGPLASTKAHQNVWEILVKITKLVQTVSSSMVSFGSPPVK